MKFNPFHQKIGIIGGGQLGKMLIESGLPWNVAYNVLDPDAHAPARRYADTFIHGPLVSKEHILGLAEISDILTYEIEHIDVETLIELKALGKRIIPDPEVLRIIQNKKFQKEFYASNNLETTQFRIVQSMNDVASAIETLSGEKFVIKSAQGGYDGKGVWIVPKSEILNGKLDLPPMEYVVEEFVENATEIAVIVARSQDGEIEAYPCVEMEFDPKLNLVDHLFAPANISSALEDSLKDLATRAVQKLDGVGVFAVELFVDQSGAIFINEIAPRPHNSGHQTIEGNTTSQYEQLNRILLNLPLGKTDLLGPVVMMNLLGQEGVEGDYTLTGLEELFKTPKANLHWYNKTSTRPGRKMGHLTVRADSVEIALQHARKIRRALQMKPFTR
jgi:5-(carboxyamino)imidazole ribonucleotide synthase